MNGRSRAAVAATLVLALAVAGTAANLFLLRLTQDPSDPVGRLSPHAVFTSPATTTPSPAARPPITTTDEQHRGADD